LTAEKRTSAITKETSSQRKMVRGSSSTHYIVKGDEGETGEQEKGQQNVVRRGRGLEIAEALIYQVEEREG